MTVNQKKRSSKNDTLSYLKEKAERDFALQEKQMKLKEKELELQARAQEAQSSLLQQQGALMVELIKSLKK